MPRPRLILVSICLAALFSFAQCAPAPDPSQGGTATGGTAATASGGVTATPQTGGTPGTASGGTIGSSGTGGTTGTPGSGGTIGTPGTGGSTAGSGGTTATGGRVGGGGSGGSGGAVGSGGAPGTGGVKADSGGIPLAKVGDQTSTSRKYLNLGDMRLINNRWGSDELGCSTTQRVYINSDRSLGWDFNRPTCGGAKAKPDYPEVEFGVAPFGSGNALLTTPAFSSTTLLPRQIKDLTSVSLQVDNFAISLQKPTIWNIDFEVWLSQRNPLTDPNPSVVAEIIVFWGWETGRWACDKSGSLTAGTHGYHLCHQSDTWANNQWRFYNFNVDNGPLTNYTGKVDVKALVDWVVSKYALSRDLWLTRIEVGSEIDDNTSGSVKIKNLIFEVNGTSKAVELGN